MMNSIKQFLVALLVLLMVVTTVWSQTRAKGAIVLKGNITFGAPISGIGPFFAQLPVNYVNAGLTTGTGFCSPPGGIYDKTVVTHAGSTTVTGVSYAPTFAGLQQAKTDQIAANQWWLLVIDAGVNIHGSSYNGDSALLTWPTSGSVTKCLVIQSSTHNTDGQIVCFKALPNYGGPSTLADNVDAHNCVWSSKNDAGKFWQFTIDASGGTYGMLFPQGPSYVLVEDMEAAPKPNTNQSAASSNPQIQVAMVFCDHCGVAYSWIHGWDPGDAGQPAGVCGTTGSWNRSGTINGNGTTTVTWATGDQFGTDFSDGTHSVGYPAVTGGTGNAFIVDSGAQSLSVITHDPAASATSMVMSATVASGSHTFNLVNPASAYATGCGDDSRGVQMNCGNCFLEFSAVIKIHWWGTECHAVSMGFGQGTTLIAEDWLEGAGAALFSGGSDIQIRGGPQTDLEVGNTYLGRDLRWRFLSASGGTSPAPPFGCGPLDGISAHDTCPFAWAVKTVTEFKECNRCWLHGVIMENGWPEGQSGHLFALTIRSVSGGDVGGVYDPSTGLPATILQNIRLDNFWFRNASQGIGFGPRSLSPGNGGGVSAIECCIDIINGLMTNVGDTEQFGNPGDELLGVSNAGQVYLATLSRTGGVAHAVVTPMNLANYDPGSGPIHSNIGTYKSAFDISSITSVSDVVTIKLNNGRTDPKVGGSFTMANVTGWNGTFTITSVKNTGLTTACTLNAYSAASTPFSQPQPCIRSDGTYGDTIVYTDSINHPGTTSLCTTLSACNALNSQALLDTLAYKITDIQIGDGLYIHNCTGGSLSNPTLFQVGSSSRTVAVTPTNPVGLDVYYTNAGLDDSGVSCQLENSSGTPSTVSFQHVSVLSPTGLATNSDGLFSQHYKHWYLHNVFATTGTNKINTCSNIAGEGTVSFACWDSASVTGTFQFFDNVLQGRTSGNWSVVPGGSPINFPSPNPSTVTCSGATATSGCLGLAGFMSTTAFPTAACSYDGSNVFNCPLMGAPYATNVNLASFTPVGTSSYSSEGVDVNQLNTSMNATQGVCPVGAYCGATGPFPY